VVNESGLQYINEEDVNEEGVWVSYIKPRIHIMSNFKVKTLHNL